MNKKVVALVITLIVIVIGVIGFMILSHKEEANNSNNTNQNESINEEQEDNNDTTTSKNKVLVLYFSATGNTEKIAGYIKNATNGDIVKIIPKDEYTSDDLNYSNDNCRANKEQNDDNARPEIKNSINVSDYDIIYLGYPIWWGTIPKIILTLLDNYDLRGKTVIPFCTSGETGIFQSEEDLKKYNSDINWISGKRFNNSTEESEVLNWVKSLHY